MEIPFVKLHGNGNDFILIDEYNGEKIPDEMKAHFAAVYCDRRFGIGGDGVLFLQKVNGAYGCACSSLMRVKPRCAETASGVLPSML
jgi:diaminopimelate epimerase